MTTYPAGPVTPYGIHMLLEGVEPTTTFTSQDGAKRFYLRGGQAPIPLGQGIAPNVQNGVVMQSISGLHPPFKHLDQQGSRQDGVTNTDTLYDAAEIDSTLIANGASAAELSQVVRDWIAANDPKKPGILENFTPEMGNWWCHARLAKTWSDRYTKSTRRQRKQMFTHSWRNDDAFWRSTDSVSDFRFGYATGVDDFERISTGGLGGGWAQTYSGGSGVCGTDGHNATWYESGTTASEVVNRKIGTGATSATDNQVIRMQYGGMVEFPLPDGAYNDIWGRLDGSGNGIRVRIGILTVTLSRFNAGVETVMRQELMAWAPLWNDEFTLVCGFEGEPRHFKVMRGPFTILDWREQGTGSALGASYRGWGFGMRAGASFLPGQTNPAAISNWSAGDNATITQSGFVNLANIGDQDGWPRYTCYGPGLFSFGNGPGVTSTITFGPLRDEQIVQLTTGPPRLRGVVDETPNPIPITENEAQQLLALFINLVSAGQVPPLLLWFESLFGIPAPQGVLYSLLNGRFTNPLLGVAQPSEAVTSHIPVTIANGNANSKIIAALTPLRRYPE